MKKIISTILVCVLLVGSIFSLASCNKILTGKYEADLLVSEVTYEFELFGKVTKTVDYPVVDDEVTEGKYEFNDAGDEITLTFGENSNTYDFSSGEEDGVKYIKLDGVKYELVD